MHLLLTCNIRKETIIPTTTTDPLHAQYISEQLLICPSQYAEARLHKPDEHTPTVAL